MSTYNISPYNDMGHLMLKPLTVRIPNHICKFVYAVIKNKIITTTDIQGHGACYYILKPGLEPSWTYTLGEDTIVIDYSKLDKYDPKWMMEPEGFSRG